MYTTFADKQVREMVEEKNKNFNPPPNPTHKPGSLINKVSEMKIYLYV